MKRLAGAILMTVAAVSVCAEEYEAGKLIEAIQCAKAPSCSYMLYLPSGYTPDREGKWPVLFAMDPRGGTEDGIRRYIKGAEKNNWIVAMSIQSRSHFEGSRVAVAAMVGDVFNRFAVDKERCYATGMSSGARMAFWLANERRQNIIGIIPCGAGDAGNRYRSRAHAYGFCGGRSFNRWDMTITFSKHIRTKGRLRFIEGSHVWADENNLFNAITWLNAKYLAKNGTREERDRFSGMLYSEVVNTLEDDIYSAYENAIVLAGVLKAPHAERARELTDGLEQDSRIKLYVQGLKAMDDFVLKHFDTSVDDCRNNRITRQQKVDADQLLERYGETPLAPVLQEFGKPSDRL